MRDDEKKLSHYEENCIVVPVPTGALKEEIEKQIHDALAEQPQDLFRDRKSRELVIVLQHFGAREPKKS
jgi:hypothetical protein